LSPYRCEASVVGEQIALKADADENVTNAVVQALRKRGMDVVTVSDRGREAADDRSLLE
jgi:hypothetical protein